MILLAMGIGSGETVLWPYITSQVGVGLLWLAIVGFTFQYFLNMEIERYTLATGETAITGFTRLWKAWGVFFVLGAILTHAWPGWATGGATVITFAFGLNNSAIPIMSIIGLISIGIALTVSPIVYQTVEKVQMVLVAIMLVFLVVAIVIATEASSWTGIVTEAPSSISNFPQYTQELGVALLLGAIAFAGAGGITNLAQSNWIRDKGLGMGIHIPRIASPITGEEEARPSLGYMMRTDEENLRRWKGWWKVANQEQLITFVTIGMLLLVGASVLVNSTIGIVGGAQGDLTFIQSEGEALKEIIAPWFGNFFWIFLFAALFSSNVGAIDLVSRITADTLKVSFLADSRFWSESKIYFTVAWLMIIAGSAILLSGFGQPLVFLIISAAGGGVLMAFYTPLLIVLNRRALPDPIKLKGWRLLAMIAITVFFIMFSLYLVYDQLINLVG